MMKKLLLVDDDAFLRDMYAIKFNASGYEVEIAETGHQALQIIKQTTDLDAILIDMIMPGMTGTELVTEIKELFPKMKAKCIMFTNLSDDAELSAAMEAGAVGCIVKAEATPSDVVQQVTNIIKQKK